MNTPENTDRDSVDVHRLVRRLKSKAEREWRTIWRQYPHHKRTSEERQIGYDEQIRISGYIQALDEILANVDVVAPATDRTPPFEHNQ